MPDDSSLQSVAIVGTGAVGTALAHALTIADVRVTAVASRNPGHARALADTLPGAAAVAITDAGSAAPLVVLAVSDSAIEQACETIGAASGVIVAHTSGSRTIEALATARARGALTGGFHPLAAIVRSYEEQDRMPEAFAALFRGAAFAIEGNAAVQAPLARLARSLGGRPFPIAAANKSAYHLGASMLAAFSAGLSQVTWEQMRAAGVPPELASAGTAHLLRTVAHNVERAPSPSAALTGPVARGDAAGVRRQADAARTLSAEARELYRVHVVHNIELAHASGRIDDTAAAALRIAFHESMILPDGTPFR